MRIRLHAKCPPQSEGAFDNAGDGPAPQSQGLADCHDSPVEPDAPEGATGSRWCKYIIAQGRNRIVGYSQGTVRTVRRDTRAKVEELNRRRYGAKGPPQKGREQPKKAS